MKELKVSAVVGVAVTVLAVVTAFAFSFATLSYQSEVTKLKRINQEYKITIEGYRLVLENIRQQIVDAGMKAK